MSIPHLQGHTLDVREHTFLPPRTESPRDSHSSGDNSNWKRDEESKNQSITKTRDSWSLEGKIECCWQKPKQYDFISAIKIVVTFDCCTSTNYMRAPPDISGCTIPRFGRLTTRRWGRRGRCRELNTPVCSIVALQLNSERLSYFSLSRNRI